MALLKFLKITKNYDPEILMNFSLLPQVREIAESRTVCILDRPYQE